MLTGGSGARSSRVGHGLPGSTKVLARPLATSVCLELGIAVQRNREVVNGFMVDEEDRRAFAGHKGGRGSLPSSGTWGVPKNQANCPVLGNTPGVLPRPRWARKVRVHLVVVRKRNGSCPKNTRKIGAEMRRRSRRRLLHPGLPSAPPPASTGAGSVLYYIYKVEWMKGRYYAVCGRCLRELPIGASIRTARRLFWRHMTEVHPGLESKWECRDETDQQSFRPRIIRPRDSQQSRVYAAEQAFSQDPTRSEWRSQGFMRKHVPDGAHRLEPGGIEGVRRFAEAVSGRLGVAAPFVRALPAGGHRCHAEFERWVIAVPARSRDLSKLVVLHEIAHLLAPDYRTEESHGPEFCRRLLTLVSTFLCPADSQALLTEMTAHGVRVGDNLTIATVA